jgi:hypothetical protein
VTVMSATRSGFTKTFTLPLIVGQSGWVWEPLPYPPSSLTWDSHPFLSPSLRTGLTDVDPHHKRLICRTLCPSPTFPRSWWSPIKVKSLALRTIAKSGKFPSTCQACETRLQKHRLSNITWLNSEGSACGRRGRELQCSCEPQDCVKSETELCLARIMNNLANECDDKCNGCIVK